MNSTLNQQFHITKTSVKKIIVLLDHGLDERLGGSNYIMEYDPIYDYQCVKDFKESFDPIAQEYAFLVEYENNHDKFFNDIFTNKPEFVVNLINYGFKGNEKTEFIPGVLEMLDIPFLNAGMTGMALAKDKHIVHKLAQTENIPTPEQIVVTTEDILNKKPISFNFFPAFLKLKQGKCSCGITDKSLVSSIEQLYDNFPLIHEIYLNQSNLKLNEWLLQEYLPGDEYNVSIIGNFNEIEVLPILKVKYNNSFYKSFDSKCGTLSTEDDHVQYADLEKDVERNIVHNAKRLFQLLECRDYCRMEFRCDTMGIPKIIDVNPHTPYGNHEAFTFSASLADLDYLSLRKTLISIGLKRHGLAS